MPACDTAAAVATTADSQRAGVWNSVYFALMHNVKARLPKARSQAADLLQTLLAGTIGGGIATAFNAPFDVVKSRMQRQLPLSLSLEPPNTGPAAARLKYRWTLQSLALIVREEGLPAAYKGFAPKLWRMVRVHFLSASSRLGVSLSPCLCSR